MPRHSGGRAQLGSPESIRLCRGYGFRARLRFAAALRNDGFRVIKPALLVAFAIAALMLALLSPLTAAAQQWPTKPVKIVAAFTPGGAADLYARLLAGELSAALGQQFYVENRPGSSGAIGSAIVARAEPDGYTLLIGGAGPMFTGPAVNPNVGYDPVRDFTHIAMIAGDGYVITASPGSGIKTFADMVSIAGQRALTTGSPGAGSLAHLIIEELRRDLKIDLQHVPYRSAADTLTSLMGNHVDLSIQSFSSVGAMLRDHRIAAIAVTDRTRAAAFPDVPSLGELGHPDIGGVAWFWLAAPAHLPPAIVAKLNGQVRRIVALPNVAQRFEADALLTEDFDPAALNQFVIDQVAKWGKLARSIGLTVQ
jgi:tripartite-type tricarboxylate transporter receptor subunit TctC